MQQTRQRPLRYLSRRSAEIVCAVIGAVRPRGHGFDHAIDEDVLREVDASIPYLPRAMQLALPLGLRLLDRAPLVLSGRLTPLTRMPREDATRALELTLASRLAPLRLLVFGLRALVFLAFYQHPSVIASMGVEWERRLEETVRLRAETLEPSRYGASR